MNNPLCFSDNLGETSMTRRLGPVHKYLLIEQGVHIGEFHFLEDLARDRV
jgi:hypothetical protein